MFQRPCAESQMLRTSTLCIGKVRAPHYDNLQDQLGYIISMPYIIFRYCTVDHDLYVASNTCASHRFYEKKLKYVEASRVMAHASTLQ